MGHFQNQWSLHRLWPDSFQKSRAPSNVLARILQFCDFLCRVNNAIAFKIFIHSQSKGKLTPFVTNIQYIYFLSAFSLTLWINGLQFGRWTVTLSFSINMLHFLYPSLYLQYNFNLLKAIVVSLIQGYPSLKKKKTRQHMKAKSLFLSLFEEKAVDFYRDKGCCTCS